MWGWQKGAMVWMWPRINAIIERTKISSTLYATNYMRNHYQPIYYQIILILYIQNIFLFTDIMLSLNYENHFNHLFYKFSIELNTLKNGAVL